MIDLDDLFSSSASSTSTPVNPGREIVPVVPSSESPNEGALGHEKDIEISAICDVVPGVPGVPAEKDRSDAIDSDRGPAASPGAAVRIVRARSDGDDLRCCSECLHLLSSGRCRVAALGRLEGYYRGYSPVPDIPCRCEAFEERTTKPEA